MYFVVILVLLLVRVNSESSTDNSTLTDRRRLTTKLDYLTGETLVTYDGNVPQTTCPPGYYRPQGSTNMKRVTGQRFDGCVMCPRGVYGETSGLTTPRCTSPCPLGTYGERQGLISKYQCTPCPAGTYGSITGLISSTCSGKCPFGTYNDATGAITMNDCKRCPVGYSKPQCPWAIQPRAGRDQDHQHQEYPGRGIPAGFADPIPIRG